MMNRIWIGGVVVCLLAAFQDDRQELYPDVKNTSFSKGEELEYRVNFGVFTVGHGSTRVEDHVYTVNKRRCYKIDAYGKTSGLVAWISKVNDNWGAYVDTAALVTHISYRKLEEGPYRRNEVVTFNHADHIAEVKVMNKQTGIYDNVKYFPVLKEVRDIVAGFMYLRNIDFAKHKKGDTVRISGFLEDTSYDLKLVYDGTQIINSHVGKIRCHRIIPMVPDNKLFDGENSVTAWFSDDENRIPVKIQAKMFIGSTGLELVSFKGLRNQLKIVQ
jgi:Protein of unknown function (DUF3108)